MTWTNVFTVIIFGLKIRSKHNSVILISSKVIPFIRSFHYTSHSVHIVRTVGAV